MDGFLQKWEIVQWLNIAHYATKDIVQVLAEHLFLYQQQEEWYQKRSSSQVLRTRNNRKVYQIMTRNQSMMADPNYTVLDDDS